MLQLRCSSGTKASSKVYRLWKSTPHAIASGVPRGSNFAFKTTNSELFGKQVAGIKCCKVLQWSFLGGAILDIQPKVQRPISYKRPFSPAFWLLSSQIANHAFTLGTIAVLPFYTLMVLAPNTELTKRSMESSIPYVMLGILYAYLLYLSWTPDTIRLMFASKYWLPELPGIAKMFANEMTLASAWIHLLVVDLFAARQIFYDGLKNGIETRHSISLCLLFCPIGIVAHALTKLWKKILQSKMKAANY